MESVASILILFTRTTAYGAILGFGMMAGAIFSHIFVLGIDVQNDGGSLFGLAVITIILCLYLLYHEQKAVIGLLPFLKQPKTHLKKIRN
jgi:hypothetical protein